METLTDKQIKIDKLRAERDQLRTVLAAYDAATKKFINKVESGRAYNSVTYAELKACYELKSKEERQSVHVHLCMTPPLAEYLDEIRKPLTHSRTGMVLHILTLLQCGKIKLP